MEESWIPFLEGILTLAPRKSSETGLDTKSQTHVTAVVAEATLPSPGFIIQAGVWYHEVADVSSMDAEF